MSRIFGFGSAAVDFRIVTADFGESYREKLLARETMLCDGGSVANALVQAAALGGECVFLGKLGDDPVGRRILAALKAERVDTGAAIVVPGAQSPFNLAVYAGERRRRVGGFLLPNVAATVSAEELEVWAELLRPEDWCLVELGEIPLDTVNAFCQLARRRGVKLAVDVDLDPLRQCGADRETVEAIFSACHLLVPNRNAIFELYRTERPDELAGQLRERFGVPAVITAGADGVYWSGEPGEPARHLAAPPVEVVDTVGAGDAFHGGLLYGLSQGLALEGAIALGSRCGADACRFFGARPRRDTK